MIFFFSDRFINLIDILFLTYQAGQHACLAVLNGGEVGSNGIHPAATQAAQHCVDIVKNTGK